MTRDPIEGGLVLARVITRLNVGGPSRHVTILGTRMGSQMNGVVLAGVPSPREGNQEPSVIASGARVVRVPTLRREVAPLDDLRALFWLYRYFRQTKPLIVHTHTAKAGTLGRLAATLAGVPIRVHTFHGHVLEGFFGRGASLAFRWIELLLSRLTTQFVAISPEIAEDLNRLGIGRGKTTIIRLGLDLASLADAAPGRLHDEFNIPGNHPLVGIVGRLVPTKGHLSFLRAATIVRSQFLSAEFVVVGDGELWDELHTQVHALGIDECVHFAGWRDDLAAIYADLAVVVCSSVSEGTSVSIIEAGAAGRPVVCTNVGGMADVVQDGANGVLVSYGDDVAIAEAVRRLLCDPELSREMGETGKRLALSRYSPDRLVSEHRALYSRLTEALR